MKQHIYLTNKNLSQLSNKGKEKLITWMMDNNHITVEINLGLNPPILTIGQLLEFLSEHFSDNQVDWGVQFGKDLAFVATTKNGEIFGKTPENREGELIDGLWDLASGVLEDEK